MSIYYDAQALLEALQVLPESLRSKYLEELKKLAWRFNGDGSDNHCICKNPMLPCPPPTNVHCSNCCKPYVLKKRPEHKRWLARQGRKCQ